jgi:hypothetical protein
MAEGYGGILQPGRYYYSSMDGCTSMMRVTLGNSRMRESRTSGSVRAKAEWLSYSTVTERVALAQWYRARTESPEGARKTTIIVALARKLLIALWRMVTLGEVPQGVVVRPTT